MNNRGLRGRSNDGLPPLHNQGRPDHNQATGTTKKTHFFAILAIVGLSGLVVGIIGLAQVLQAGSLTNQAIIMMATGGGGTLLLIIGAIGLFKNRQISNPSNYNTQPENTEDNESVIGNNQTVVPLKRTEVPRVENFTVFGAREWDHFYGDVGAEPDYPQDIIDILNDQCPFSGDEKTKVKDTHMLVLIPATVGGEALTLNRLGELIQHPKNSGRVTKYDNYHSDVEKVYGNTPSGRSYWVLMTKDVISAREGQLYTIKDELVRQHQGRGYTLPQALEAAVCILMEHVVDGNQLFGISPLTYTLCSEMTQIGDGLYPVMVGGFVGDKGLDVVSSCCRYNFGVGLLRKFL